MAQQNISAVQLMQKSALCTIIQLRWFECHVLYINTTEQFQVVPWSMQVVKVTRERSAFKCQSSYLPKCTNLSGFVFNRHTRVGYDVTWAQCRLVPWRLVCQPLAVIQDCKTDLQGIPSTVHTYLRSNHVKIPILFKLKFDRLLAKCFTQCQLHIFSPVANKPGRNQIKPLQRKLRRFKFPGTGIRHQPDAQLLRHGYK